MYLRREPKKQPESFQSIAVQCRAWPEADAVGKTGVVQLALAARGPRASLHRQA